MRISPLPGCSANASTALPSSFRRRASSFTYSRLACGPDPRLLVCWACGSQPRQQSACNPAGDGRVDHGPIQAQYQGERTSGLVLLCVALPFLPLSTAGQQGCTHKPCIHTPHPSAARLLPTPTSLALP